MSTRSKRATFTPPFTISKNNTKISFAPPFQPLSSDPRNDVRPFSLSFLDKSSSAEGMSLESYVNKLLTAEEKAAFYRDLAKNDGQPNISKIAKSCRSKAARIREQARQLDEHEAELVLRKARGLENLALDLENPTPPEVLDSQHEWEWSYEESASSAALAAKKQFGIEKAPIILGQPSRKKLEAQRKADLAAGGWWGLPDGENLVDEQGWPNLQPVFEPGVRGENRMEAKDYQMKALFWENIHKWNYDQQALYYFCGPNKPSDWEEAIFVRSQKHPFALRLLLACSEPIDRLLDLANMGDDRAARVAIQKVEDLVRKLNIYAKLNPKAFQKAAGLLTQWPVMYSPHPAINQNSGTIAAQVKLGAAYPFQVVPEAEWNPRELGCRVALNLYHYVKTVRQHPESHREFPFTADAEKLPPITDERAANKWWVVAQQSLLFSYPKPELEPKLRPLTEIKNRGKVRNKILDCIKRRFFSLFPKPAR